MAFWGIEVKPGKPYTLTDEERGRLHVTQATLGSGTSNKKSIVQCQVGDKQPIYLCSLLPERLETSALNLEFEEDEKVTFSIVGPQSVHLSGFFYGEESDEDDDHGDCYGCEDDEMGIDSEDVDDSSDYDSEFDSEEGDDDCSEDDLCCAYPHSPVRNSGVRIEEIVDDGKPTKDNDSSKRAKKKKTESSMSDGNENSNSQLVPKSRTSDAVLESEDEDGFPVPARDKKSQNKSEETNAASGKNLKRKSGAINQDEQPAREIDTTENEVKQKKNKKKKVVQKLDSSLENGKPDSDGKKESPVAEVGSNMKTSSEKKKEKKKKKQNKLQENAPTLSADKSESDLEKQERGEAAKPQQVRTFANGLVIEEIAMGKPDGKRASAGKTVNVRYIGKLKKNGKIFDSNIGKAPFKFRLGIGQVIKGWDVGVSGMRVGDKRRLTIPPEMGYGAKGAGSAIPPNAWLLFDVELVNVK